MKIVREFEISNDIFRRNNRQTIRQITTKKTTRNRMKLEKSSSQVRHDRRLRP